MGHGDGKQAGHSGAEGKVIGRALPSSQRYGGIGLRRQRVTVCQNENGATSCSVQLYLLRHGIAEIGRLGSPDSERALVPEGRRKLREVLRAAKLAGVAPKLILTSPYRRAVETAEIAAGVLGYKEELLRTKALVPDSDPHAVWEEVRVHKDAEQMMLVGHEPLFSHLTAHLLACPSLQIDFKKGAIVRVDVEQFGVQPRGELRWFLTPKLAAPSNNR
jgi:phosphohistidine phosphatase